MDQNVQEQIQQQKVVQNERIGNYEFIKTLGSGTFGKVKLATHIGTGQKVAIKIIDKKSLKDDEDRQRVDRQVQIMQIVRHPNIIQFYQRIQTQNAIYLVLELAENGQLFKLMQDQIRLNERAAGRIFIQLMNAVEYLHRLGICHRDLKPQNILLDVDYNIKLVDFGLSNVFQNGQYLRTACGSPCYAPPEMVSGNVYQGQIGDVWSMGIIFYGMICGTLPFQQNTTKELYKKVIQGFYYIPSDISLQATQAIRKMLVTNPKQRITIPQLRKLKFFKDLKQVQPRIIGIIVGFHPMPIDNEIIQKMRSIQPFEKQKVEEEIKQNKHTKYTALYYLLQKQSLRNGGKTIVDLQYFLQSSQRYKSQYGILPPQFIENSSSDVKQDFNQSVKTIKNSKAREKINMSNHKGLSKQKRQPIEVVKKFKTQKNTVNLTQRSQKQEKTEQVVTILRKYRNQKTQSSQDKINKSDTKKNMQTSRTRRNLKTVLSSDKSCEKPSKSRDHQNVSSSNSRKKSQKKVRTQNTNKLALNLWNTYFEKVIETSAKISNPPTSGRGNKLKIRQKQKQSDKAFTQNLQKLKQGFLKLPYMRKGKSNDEELQERTLKRN